MNITDQVAVVRQAEAAVKNWSLATLGAVAEAIPQVARDHEVNAWDWAVTVQALRQPWESPEMAAGRTARYMTLHAERWDQVPTLPALIATAAKPPPAEEPQRFPWEDPMPAPMGAPCPKHRALGVNPGCPDCDHG